MNEISKPITLLREDFIENITSTINNSGLPYFVIEDILKYYVQEVHSASVRQYEIDKKNYIEKNNSEDREEKEE